MNSTSKQSICFQCGKPRIQTNQYTEYVNGSSVVTTESICSDPKCQKRTMNAIEKERQRREVAFANKQNKGFALKK